MATRQKEVVVEVEGEVYKGGDAAPWKVRLSMKVVPEEGGSITDTDVIETTNRLQSLLNLALRDTEIDPERGAMKPVPNAPPRSLEVLKEVYTPRSAEHVDSLVWEGQITSAEGALLMGDFKGTGPGSTPKPRPARTPEDLIREFDLKDMRDANHARGKEVISYEEWASLKRYFSQRNTSPA
jgi:hypothetical protein